MTSRLTLITGASRGMGRAMASQLLAYLARADFGSKPVADVRAD